MNAQGNDPRFDPSGLAWDSLGTVLAVARQGSLSGASRLLGVNHSTVVRRIAGLEAACGHVLFRRLARGCVPTAAGEILIDAAQRMADAVDQAATRLGTGEVGLRGTIRLTAPDDLANHFLIGPLAAFRRTHPGVVIEMALDRRMFNLSRREADVAIRASGRPPEGMAAARRIIKLGGAVYASRAAFPELQAIAEAPFAALRHLPWVGWEDDGASNNLKQWVHQRCPRDAFVYRSNNLSHQAEAVRAGVGLGALPCFIGDAWPDLVRLVPPQDPMATDLWLLTHPDLIAVPRVAALIAFLEEECVRRAALLVGGTATPQ